MSLFSRVAGFFRGVVSRSPAHEDVVRQEIEHELSENDIANDDELSDIWHNTVEENIGDLDELKDFTVDASGAELFRVGWVDDGANEDERQAARDEFFDLMEAYDISRDEFDWDSWRDWYEDA